MKLYHELAEYYFAIENSHRSINDDVALVRKLLHGRAGPALLDLGCGTGEHLDLLKNHQIKCTGIDSSPDMLFVARKRFPNAAEFITADMVNFDFFENFDMVICLFGSFNYILADADVDRVFWNTWRSLKPGGIALFEIWNALPVLKIKSKDLDVVSMITSGGKVIKRERGFMLLDNAERTVVEVNYRYTISGEEGTITMKDRHVMRAYRHDEVVGFLTGNGFSVKDVYSNSKMELYRNSSNKMLVYAVKP